MGGAATAASGVTIGAGGCSTGFTTDGGRALFVRGTTSGGGTPASVSSAIGSSRAWITPLVTGTNR